MKYLKSLNEKVGSGISIGDLKDLLQDLIDDGFSFDLSRIKGSGVTNIYHLNEEDLLPAEFKLWVYKSNRNEKYKIIDIKDLLIRLKSVLTESKLQLVRFDFVFSLNLDTLEGDFEIGNDFNLNRATRMVKETEIYFKKKKPWQ